MRKIYKILIIVLIILVAFIAVSSAIISYMVLNAKFCMGVGVFATEEDANIALPRYAHELGEQYAGSEITYNFADKKGPVTLSVCTYKNR